MRSIRTNVLLSSFVFLLLTVSFTAQAQGVQSFRPNVPINPNCNGYLEYLPEGYQSSGQTYPLLIFVEGNSETGDGSLNDLQRLLSNGPPFFISKNSFPSSFTVNGQTHRLIIITPQFKTPIWQRYPTPQELNSVIDYAVQNYRVNTNKIYLIGISSGGGVAWDYAAYSVAYSNRIAALMPFTGTSTPTEAKAKIIASTNLPIWAFHNKLDSGVNVKFTTGYIDTINMQSPNPLARVTLFDQGGHDSWFNPLSGSYKENNMNVYEWMLQYSRNGAPPANQPPTANAGASQTITLPASSVTLSGSGTDPDGTIASYAWTKFSGGAVSIASPSTASTSVSGLSQGTYVFRLTVTDNNGATAFSDVTITVNAAANQPPAANAGANQTITLPASSVTLSGSGTDPDGTIASYAWTKFSGGAVSIASPSTASTSVSGLSQGTYVFRLTVTDNNGATAFSDVTITVNAAANQPPAANAGANQTITLPASSVTLSGSGTDPDGTIASYAWTKFSGGAVSIASPSTASTSVSGLSQGTYVFRLTVTDNNGATAFSDVTITVNAAANQPPAANAGANQTITLPASSVTLSGSGTDPDGTIASYAWTKFSGGAASIASPSTASTSVSGLSQGIYVFRLTVTDNNGATAFSDVTITVNPPPPPSSSFRIEAENYAAMSGVLTENTLDAGGGLNVGWIDNGDWMDYSINPASAGTYTINLRIATPNNNAQLQIKKQDGTILSTVNLPNTWGYQSWQTISTTITLAAGAQTIRLQSSSTAGWNINWLDLVGGGPVANQPPAANAGANQTITLPASSVTLSGSGTDPDGTIASYAWTKFSGGAASIASPSTASTSVSGLSQGTYVFRLTVTDNNGATAFSDVTITVNAAASGGGTIRIEAENYAAMSGVLTENTLDAGGGLNVGWIDNGDWMDYSINPASAGTYTINLRIATPNNNAQLQIKKQDGTILSTVNLPNTWGYQSWQTISTTITLAAGAQTIRLQSSSTAGWNINWLDLVGGGPVANQPPAANAGANQTITLPANSVTLSGSGTDPDGTIASYAWTKFSGGAASIASPSTASTAVSGLSQGTYVFRLTVTDNNGATAFSDVTITVNAAASGGGTIRIEAENYAAMSGVLTENTLDAGGGLNVGWIDNGDWMDYSINPASAGTYTINLRIATPNNNAQLQIKKQDGTILSTVNLPNTWGYQSWQTISTTITLAAGAQTIRLQSSSTAGWNINWLDLVGSGITQRNPLEINEVAKTFLFEIFPNPAQDYCTLNLNNPYSGNLYVRVLNLQGAIQKEVIINKAQGLNQTKISLKDLPAGTYIIKLSMKGWEGTKTLIKL